MVKLTCSRCVFNQRERPMRTSYGELASVNHVNGEMKRLADQFEQDERYIQFMDDDNDEYAVSGALTTDIVVAVTSPTGTINKFSRVAGVTVSIDSATAAGATINGGADPVVLEFVNGAAILTVAATGTGDVKLSLTDSAGTGLNTQETVTVIFS